MSATDPAVTFLLVLVIGVIAGPLAGDYWKCVNVTICSAFCYRFQASPVDFRNSCKSGPGHLSFYRIYCSNCLWIPDLAGKHAPPVSVWTG